MSFVTFLIAVAVIVAGGVFGLFLIAAWCLREARDLLDAYRGITTDVPCPQTGRPVTAHLGRRPGTHGLRVLWCERFPEGTPRCATECFRAFTGGPVSAAS